MTKKVNVVMTPEFVRDIQDSKHGNMGKQILSHVFDDDGLFKTANNDHPYDGIKDGHIRWIQMSGAGLRLIYIRKGDTVYLHRAVGKADESGIPDPKSPSVAVVISGLPPEISEGFRESSAAIKARLLTNREPVFIREAMRKMYHASHSDVVMVSPRISNPLLSFKGEVGVFLDRAIEEGTRAIVITQPPNLSDLPFYEDLARRNIEVYFVQNLQTRLFLFNVRPGEQKKGIDPVKPTAMLGSAELTQQSLEIGGVGRNEELCYSFPESHFAAFHDYAYRLIKFGMDLQGFKIQIKGL